MFASRKTRSLTRGSDDRVGWCRDQALASALLAGQRRSRRHRSRSREGTARAVGACSARQAAATNEMTAATVAYESSESKSLAYLTSLVSPLRSPEVNQSQRTWRLQLLATFSRNTTKRRRERPRRKKADPVLPRSAVIRLPSSLPQELVGAIQWGFKSPLPHHSQTHVTTGLDGRFRHSLARYREASETPAVRLVFDSFQLIPGSS
jgi:hypothetical protein